MKRWTAVAALTAALMMANVRAYTDVLDPQRGDHVVRGIVAIVPSMDQCYGIEREDVTGWLSVYGGECE